MRILAMVSVFTLNLWYDGHSHLMNAGNHCTVAVVVIYRSQCRTGVKEFLAVFQCESHAPFGRAFWGKFFFSMKIYAIGIAKDVQ